MAHDTPRPELLDVTAAELWTGDLTEEGRTVYALDRFHPDVVMVTLVTERLGDDGYPLPEGGQRHRGHLRGAGGLVVTDTPVGHVLDADQHNDDPDAWWACSQPERPGDIHTVYWEHCTWCMTKLALDVPASAELRRHLTEHLDWHGANCVLAGQVNENGTLAPPPSHREPRPARDAALRLPNTPTRQEATP